MIRKITAVVITDGGEVKDVNTTTGQLHYLLRQILNEGGYFEPRSFSGGVVLMDDYGKLSNKGINWIATQLLKSEARIIDDDFVVGNVVVVGPAANDGFETSITVEQLRDSHPEIFARSRR